MGIFGATLSPSLPQIPNFPPQVTQNLPVKEGSSEVPLLRVGWSVDFSHSQLGESFKSSPKSPNPAQNPKIHWNPPNPIFLSYSRRG